MPIGLYALAIGGFGIGLTEFIIAGILTELADDLDVSVSTASGLVSGYAFAVAVGALVLSAALSRVQPKRALLGLMLLFIVGNTVSALAPNYLVMLAGRVLAAFAHGAYFGIGAVLAASLVPATKKAGAIAFMFGGLTLANALGVPLGTVIAQHFGWRATFWVISVIGIIATVGIAFLVKATDHSQAPSLRRELASFGRLQVWFSLGLTTLVYGGMFGAFMFSEPLLRNVTGYSESVIPVLLVLFGVGLFAGNVLGGKAADRNLDATLIWLTLAMAVVLAAFAFASHNKISAAIGLVVLGGVGFATVPGLQMRVMKFASDAPTLASGANIAAFNVGNALGVWLGGFAYAGSWGYTGPVWVGAILAVFGFALVLIATAKSRRSTTDRVSKEMSEPVATVV